MKRAALFLALAACGSADTPPPHVTISAPSTTTPSALPEITTTSQRPPTTQRASRSARVTPTPSRPNPRRTGCGGWEGLIGQYPWDVGQACRVMMCESGGRADARNPSSSATGLFQILRGPLDPTENVRVAYGMWAKRGWQPWVCKP